MSKMKVNIVTINGYHNYGNRLQLFALSNIIKQFGGEVFVYWPKRFRTKVKELIKYDTPLRVKNKKETKLRRFTRKNMPKVSNCCSVDYCVVGSDQVWNPNWLDKRQYLLDVPCDGKVISYAASMGVDVLTKEQSQIFKKYLKNYDTLSVREKSAKKILQPLIDKPIEVVLDPTLLLDASVYKNLEKKPHNIKTGEKFILCYILGGREYMDTIKKFADEYNYRIILFSDKEGSDYGIEEFLYLVHHAELICTDSFHACAFSFIFERPFVIFRRSGGADYMYSRLQNLVDVFHFYNHEYNGKNITKKNLLTDYEESKRILKREQKKSLNYLKNALGIKNEG